ncbi:MAG: hypothetical protein JXA14_06905 [Anaerolineae bacterium]|nr:hypothetical protein [Anaerolineae bacterium]
MSGRGRLWQVVALMLSLWALLSVASYYLLAAPRQNRFDFYPRWVGARVVLARENPYSQEVTWRIQEGMFDRRLSVEEDQQGFAYSATITWLLLPFWLLPFRLAISLWCGLQFLLLLLMLPGMTVILGWRLRPIPMAVLLIFSVLIYRYPVNAYLLGQFVAFSVVCVLCAWWAIVQDRPLLAVLGLLGAMVRPEVVLLPLLVLLAAAWKEGYRRVAFGWVGGMGLLWLMTRVWIGPWVASYLSGIRAYADYSFPRWPPMAAGPVWLAMLIACAVLAWGGWMWLQTRSLSTREQLPWRIATSALVALVCLPQTNNYTLILGLPAAWVVLWAGRRRWLDWLPVLAVLASPWMFHLTGGILPVGLEQLLIPVTLGILLTWRWLSRRDWAKEGVG